MQRAALLASIAVVAALGTGTGGAGELVIRLAASGEAVEAGPLDPPLAAAWRQTSAIERWKLFTVYTGDSPPAAGSGQPAVAGRVELSGNWLRFTPRYPFVAGLAYSAVLDLPGFGDGRPPLVERFELPRPEREPTTVVEAIYPTADHLPANLLRFYVAFSAPMRRGEAHKFLRLQKASGEPAEAAFLDLPQELWDPETTRLTLFLDPGRIKRGLRPHLEGGAPLEEGETYVLTLDPEWRDARGAPLVSGFEKRFNVGAADRNVPDPKTWEIEAPTAASRDPVTLGFPEPLDRGLLERVIQVRKTSGPRIEGRVEVTDGETAWSFHPAAPWPAGSYEIVVRTVLEDLAGNNLLGLFDVEVGAPRQGLGEKRDRVELPFEIR